MLAENLSGVAVGASGGWLLLDDQRRLLARGTSADRWRIEREGARIRAATGNTRTGWMDGPIYAVPVVGSFVIFNAHRYRGEIAFSPKQGGLLVVNVLPIDDYIAGVVALEIGGRVAAESAAVQAQAVTARSYAYVHLDASAARGFDVTSSITDQAYGGVDAESAVATRAVVTTRGLVLKYAGRVVNAPYSSSCGGETAAASDVWRTTDEPYLKRVSDRIPGTDRFYCDIGPRFHWTREFDSTALENVVSRYLSALVPAPGAGTGRPRGIVIESRTPANRVATLKFTTDRGDYTVRGNDIRSVLRDASGDILSSTYFSIDSSYERDGHLIQLTLRGGGNGHGVGMCQWGAIGRARAGQDFMTILSTYYPGTTIGLLR
jgi:stage II sporulation protein D